MSCRILKVQTFVVVATLSLAMLLFAAQHRNVAAGPQFRAVIDLSHSDKTATAGLVSGETTLISPAGLGGAWTLESLPTTRLIAPLAVIEAERKNFPDSESLLTMDDVAAYERAHGPISQGAIILLVSSNKSAMPLFSHDALHFLIEARNVVGIGTAGRQIVSADENSYLARHGIYELENVDNLSLVPRSGVIAVAAPQNISGAAEGPVRLMALVR